MRMLTSLAVREARCEIDNAVLTLSRRRMPETSVALGLSDLPVRRVAFEPLFLFLLFDVAGGL